jgi:hypothetical protein
LLVKELLEYANPNKLSIAGQRFWHATEVSIDSLTFHYGIDESPILRNAFNGFSKSLIIASWSPD